MILDGGAVGIGLESTIVDLSTGVPTILRPGYITGEMLEDVLGEVQVDPAILSQKMNPNIVATGHEVSSLRTEGTDDDHRGRHQ